MNSDMVKPEKFGHLHLVYHFTVPLILLNHNQDLKVGLSPSRKVCIICFFEKPLKMMNNAFYLILKALFVHKVFKFLS